MTLKDIANEANVSTMTVSRVINNKHNLVSKETQIKVKEIIEKYGYVPNSSARSLSSSSSKIIAAFVQGSNNQLKHYHSAVFLGEIINSVQKENYNVMVHFIEDYTEVIKNLRAWNAEGAIFLGIFEKNFLQINNVIDVPLIFTDTYSKVREFTNVGIDDFKGGYIAAKHFIEKGHKELAIIKPFIPQGVSPVLLERVNGFKQGLIDNNLEVKENMVIEFHSYSDAVVSLLQLKKIPTGIFPVYDEIACGIIKELEKNKFKIPDDFSIIGFDNNPLGQIISPPITTISQNVEEKAVAAVDLLFKKIRNNKINVQNIILDVNLIERNSVKDLNFKK
ncbi:MAG: LacI family DNA-binding transcriptional regulator [Lachnospirales bacterium]